MLREIAGHCLKEIEMNKKKYQFQGANTDWAPQSTIWENSVL